LAHAVGLGEKLELAAVRAAIAGAAEIPHQLWLNINASPAVLMDGGELQRMLSSLGRDVVLEVTEHSEITDYQGFRRAAQELGPRVRLAVDDAGAGFASLRHIIELRPAFVKLDRQVIAGIDHDEARQSMVAGLRHFATNTGCWLIAEGVETSAELQTLRELGVRYVQGYLLGAPQPRASLIGDSERWVGRESAA
jgi:EAL domain-containing protein (putative c-di-GMP-specific phosphodiesterase class I)